MMSPFDGLLGEALASLATLFIVFIGIGFLAVILMFIADVSQKSGCCGLLKFTGFQCCLMNQP